MTGEPTNLRSVDGQGEDRQLARPRHPSAGGGYAPARLTARLAQVLAAEGHPWPELAAAVMAQRGGTGLDRASFAGRVGMREDTLAGIEDGRFGADRPSPRMGAT